MVGSLSGSWTGVYDYDADAPFGEATPFTAKLRQNGTALAGETVETMRSGGEVLPGLTATLSGTVAGRDVTFTKRYTVAGFQPVEYAGVLAADGSRIEGRWLIGGGFRRIGLRRVATPPLEGPFVMDRRRLQAAVRALETAAGAAGRR